MDAQTFVDALNKYASEVAVSNTISLVENPPGRAPEKKLVALNAWYRSLSPTDHVLIKEMLELAASDAVFGVLAILDGSRKIDRNMQVNDHFELIVRIGGVETVLSGPRGRLLHELF